ncbi:MAG: glycosyltransferase [Candidatus Bathyarchaeia archaeon]
MISIISVINNEQCAKEYLLRALNRQNAKYQSLLIDNTSGVYKNAAQAYNYAGSKANGDYLIFVHQDVFFLFRGWLKEIEDYLSTLSDVGVAGLAGMVKPRFLNEFELFSRYFLLNKIGNYRLWFSLYGRGNLLQEIGGQPGPGRIISEPVPVQTVDELMLIVPAKVFETNKFDEKVCDNWHLYGVDFSLTVSKKGLKTYVLPSSAIHHSGGKIDSFYVQTLKKLIEKHEMEKIINTTCGLIPTKKEFMDFFWERYPSLVPNMAKNGHKFVFTCLSLLWTF